jgi:hypothetical protein
MLQTPENAKQSQAFVRAANDLVDEQAQLGEAAEIFDLAHPRGGLILS